MSATKVWKTLEVKKRSGDVVKLRFQQLPISRKEEIIQFFIKNELQNNIFIKAAGINNNKEAVKEHEMFAKASFPFEIPHITICCVDDGSENGGAFVGLSFVYLMKKTDKATDLLGRFPVNTQEMKTWFDMWLNLEESSKLQQQFDEHFSGTTVVDPDYEQLGIIEEFIKIRTLMTKEHNVPMVGDWMNTEEEQKAAEKDKWKTEVELKIEDICKSCNVTFEDNRIIKFMYKVIT